MTALPYFLQLGDHSDASETKLLHRMGKQNLQEGFQAKPTGSTAVRQKLFGDGLQHFAQAEQGLQNALPQPTSPQGSRGLADMLGPLAPSSSGE